MLLIFLACALLRIQLQPDSKASAAVATRPATISDALVIAVATDTPAERALTVTGGRTDKPTYNELEAYAVERSDKLLESLRKLGISMLAFPYGGHGPDAYERADRAAAKEFAERARAHGFLTGLWLPVDSVNPA